MTSDRPFDSIRVLDVTASHAGAIAAMYLADFGADVVRVEAGVTAAERRSEETPLSVYANRNKRIATIAATARARIPELRRLIRRSDVFVVDQPSARLDEIGLDATTLCTANARLVHLWMPAHAQRGRSCSLPADDLLLASRTGVADQQPATVDRPVVPVVPHLTYEQGALGAIAAAAALVGRERTGRGRAVTVSGLHAVAAMNATIMFGHQGSVRPFGGPKGGLGSSPSYRMYQCRDRRWLFVAALTPVFLEKLLAATEVEDLAGLPPVDGDLQRSRDPEVQALLGDALEGRMRQKDRSQWLTILEGAGVPHAPVDGREAWLASPTVAANNGMVTVGHAQLGPVAMPGVMVELSATPGRVEFLADPGAVVDSSGVWSDVPGHPARTDGSPAEAPTLPLDGITVLDLGSFLAGPFGADVLGDFGASVVKVEHPAGDGYRSGPATYASVNKGKRNLSLDLKTTRAMEVLLELVRRADVVVDNVRAGVPERLGTHFDALCRVNPAIVRCTITAWGEGPLRESPCFDALLQARGGLMAAQAGGGDPVLQAMAVHDVGSGTLAAFGATAALFARRLTGRGQEVKTSLTHASLMQQAGELTSFAGSPAPLEGCEDYLGPSTLHRLYRCSDGWIAVNAEGRGERALRAAVTSPAEGAAQTGEPEVVAIETACAALRIDDALDALASASIPAVAVLGRGAIVGDPWLAENGFFAPVDDTDHGAMLIVRGYADWGCSRPGHRSRSHALGEDTAALLREAGIGADLVEEVASAG